MVFGVTRVPLTNKILPCIKNKSMFQITLNVFYVSLDFKLAFLSSRHNALLKNASKSIICPAVRVVLLTPAP